MWGLCVKCHHWQGKEVLSRLGCAPSWSAAEPSTGLSPIGSDQQDPGVVMLDLGQDLRDQRPGRVCVEVDVGNPGVGEGIEADRLVIVWIRGKVKRKLW